MDSIPRYNGWLLLAHPHFLDQFARMANDVDFVIARHPDQYHLDEKVKLFAHLEKRVFEDVPADPASRSWLLGNTLGTTNRAWRRAPFGGQYRLFFRFDSKARIIIYAWANDESTLRAYENSDDAYRTFQRLLSSGKVPTNWEELLQSSKSLEK